MSSIESINPANLEVRKTYEAFSSDEVSKVVIEAQSTASVWSKTDFALRSKLFNRLGEILDANKEKYGQIITEEMGKPLAQGTGEIAKCAWLCRYYAEHAPQFIAKEHIVTEAKESYVVFRPLGTILAIMPWNFPFWQVFRAAVPAIMAGNTVVLKHASNVPECSELIERLFREAGFPDHALRHVLMPGSQVEQLIAHPGIAGVTLTGSTEAGRKVAATAGKHLKKTVLELGGSDPYIVCKDANLEKAVETCVAGRLVNTGQSCIAAKRFLVANELKKEFENRMVDLLKQKVADDPQKTGVHLGPLARKDLQRDLHNQVKNSVNQGAELLLGGKLPDDKGSFYPATVLTNVAPGMSVWSEETFGPVAAIRGFDNEREAVAMAADTQYGLGAAIFSEDERRAKLLAEEKIPAGCVFINDHVKSDPRLPFGGIKQSGYGRELGSFGMREFVNIKTVQLA